MSQPFETRDDGYSQHLSEGELAEGDFAFNMIFFDRLKTLIDRSKNIHARTSEGDLAELHLDVESTKLLGGAPLRALFKRWKLEEGAVLDFRMSVDGAVFIAPNIPETAISSQKFSTSGETKKMSDATNTILYGPPGTGKTYSTIIRAMSIVDGIKYSLRMEPSEYDELKSRFDQLKLVGQIEFVTFHQSYGYEDFMQGIRPNAVNGQIYYEVKDGVLKRIANRALHEQTASHQGRHRLAETETDFDASVRSLKAAFAMAPGNALKFSFFGDASGEATFNEEMQALDLNASEAKKQMSVPLATLKPLWDRREAINVPSDTGQPALESLFVLAALRLLKARNEQVDELGKVATEPKQFVLIIDEINRGNISKIFGELITLVEPDKRIGARYETRVTLPHTSDESEEQSFGLPSNLHLVGTMNTADRSIALLDTALRRRFEFEELMPDASLLKEDVGGVDLARMLEAINQRIEVLYDRDHTIGHAYLMGVSSIEELRNVFRHRVLPLLQEYFYENWSKIRSVLNDTAAGDFVVQHKTIQLSSDDIDGDESDQRPVYSVNRVVFPIEAFQRIYGK
jgi:5-methylcytosine-specific restriction protein B